MLKGKKNNTNDRIACVIEDAVSVLVTVDVICINTFCNIDCGGYVGYSLNTMFWARDGILDI